MGTKDVQQHPQQASIFSDDGICVVCGETVESIMYSGKLITLIWCSTKCTSVYSARWMTPKLARFVDEYLIDLNGTQAAIRAGYSKRSAQVIASENLCKPIVQQALSLAMVERAQRTRLTADKVLDDIEQIKQDAMQRVSSITVDAKGNAVKVKAMINHAAALKACELHGRHLKMFTDTVDVNATHDVNFATKESKNWLDDVIEGINLTTG